MTTARASQDVNQMVQELEAQGRQAVRKASPWIVRLGRAGLVAKGMVYVILGWLALQSTFGPRGELTDQRGALQSVLRQPFGSALLGILCFGLLAYMLWRVVQALVNPEREPHDFGGWSKRVFRLGSGIVYGGLGLAAARLLIGMQTQHRTPSDWTARVLAWPLGKWLVAAAGLTVVGYGMFRIYKAWQGELKKQLVLDDYAAQARGAITTMGRVGQAARGIVFVVIGAFVFFAGLHTNPSEARGIAGAMAFIERAPYGPFLLAAVAVGLIAYGLFQFVEARYRRIRAE